MRLRRLLLVALLGLAAPLTAQATPEAAAEAFGAAIVASDGARAARIMHPDALRLFRGLLEPMMATEGSRPMAGQLFGVHSAAELAATPDTVLFARLLNNTLKQQGLGQAAQGATFMALGHITLGDTVLVVARLTLPLDSSLAITSYELIPTLPYKGSYRALLKADMTNMLKMLEARFKKTS